MSKLKPFLKPRSIISDIFTAARKFKWQKRKRKKHTIKWLNKYAHPLTMGSCDYNQSYSNLWTSCSNWIIICFSSRTWFWLTPNKDKLFLKDLLNLIILVSSTKSFQSKHRISVIFPSTGRPFELDEWTRRKLFIKQAAKWPMATLNDGTWHQSTHSLHVKIIPNLMAKWVMVMLWNQSRTSGV